MFDTPVRSPGGAAIGPERDQSLEHVMRLASHAFSREQVEKAEAAYRRHIERFPEDAGTEALHGLGHVGNDVEVREASSRRLGLTDEQHRQREALLEHTNEGYRVDPASPGSSGTLLHARERLRRWLDDHPDDGLVRSRLETFTEYAELAEVMRVVAPG